MSIPLDYDCMECYLTRHVNIARSLGTEEQATIFAKEIMKMYLNAPAYATALYVGPQIADLLHDMYGLEIDRYRQEKIDSNRFVLERLDHIRERILAAEDPVYAGLQYAILGNYLDFAALRDQVSFEKLDEMLTDAKEITVAPEVYASLCDDMAKGRNLLYLTDNAGEIGFDRLLAEEIAKKYPHLSITFCVRGAPAANDATREDAAEMGIPFPIIDNGNRVAGTHIELCSEECVRALENADVILSKGMGNVETLLGCGYNVYYAFLVKCPRFAKLFDKPMFTPLLVKERK